MFIIIKHVKTGHEQRIQKKDWLEYQHLYVGYKKAKDAELEKFEKQPDGSYEIPGLEIVDDEQEEQETEDVGYATTDKSEDKKSGKVEDDLKAEPKILPIQKNKNKKKVD